MIRINLYPDQRRSQLEAKSALQLQGMVVIGTIVVAVIVCAIIASIKEGEFKAVEAEKAQKIVRLDGLKKEIGVVNNLEREKVALETKRQSIAQLRENQEGPVLIMDHVSRSMTEAKVWLTSLSVNGKSVMLSGVALTNEDIVKFQTALQSKPSFSTVNLIVSQKEGGSADQPLYRFELSLGG